MSQKRSGSHTLKQSFYKLFLSISAILLIPMSFIPMGFVFSLRNTVLEDYLVLNSRLAETVSRTVDTAITSQTNYAYSLSNNMLLRELSANLVDGRAEMQNACRELRDYMRTILFNNISDMTALYFPKLDLVVSSQATQSTFSDYYKRYVCYGDATDKEFQEMLNTVDQHHYWSSAFCTPAVTGHRSMIIYAQPVNMGYLMPRSYYITFIAESTLIGLVRESFDDDIPFVLFDDTGRELMRTGGVEQEWTDQALTAPETSAVHASSGGVCRLFRTPQLSSGLQFVFFIPESSVMMSVSRFVLIFITALVVSLLSGLLISNRFARHLHVPYENLISIAFPEGASLGDSTMKEGFSIVATRLREERLQSRRFQEELQTYYNMERDKTLLLLMARSSYLSEDELREALEICGLPMNGSAYQVALLKTAEGCAEPVLPFETDGADSVIRSIRLSRRHLLVLAAFPARTQSPLTAALEPLRDRFNVGLSQIHASLYDLSACLDEADANGSASLALYYPIDMELQIIAAVRAGQNVVVSRLLDDIRRINQESHQEGLSYLNAAILATAEKLSEELQPDQRSAFDAELQKFSPSGRLNPDSQQVFSDLLTLYRQLCADMSSSMHDKNQSVIENVRQYLSEQYADPGLCLDSVAEHLGVSYYFSVAYFQSRNQTVLFGHAQRHTYPPGNGSVGQHQLACANDRRTGRIHELVYLPSRIQEAHRPDARSVQTKPSCGPARLNGRPSDTRVCTGCMFVISHPIKDCISTVSYKPQNLITWAEAAS